MQIGSGFLGFTNLDGVMMTDNLQEDEAIQLINFYGNQLFNSPKGNSKKQQKSPKVPKELKPTSHITKQNQTQHSNQKPIDPYEVERQYQIQRLKFMQTADKARNQWKTSQQDPYPLAKPKYRKVSPQPVKKPYPPPGPATVKQKKMQQPFIGRHQSDHNRLMKKFELIRKQLEMDESRKKQNEYRKYEKPTRDNQDNRSNSEKAMKVQGFIRRMEADTKRRVQTETRNSIEHMLNQQQRDLVQQNYRSITPNKDSSYNSYEAGRSRNLKRRKKLQQEFQSTLFQPRTTNPKVQLSKFGIGHALQDMRTSRHRSTNPVIHLKSPQELQFLIGKCV